MCKGSFSDLKVYSLFVDFNGVGSFSNMKVYSLFDEVEVNIVI